MKGNDMPVCCQGGAQNHQPEQGGWVERRESAVRAYFEWMPIREAWDGSGGPMIYRGEIPASAVTEGLEYYIESVDEAGRHATFPAGAGVERIRVTVTRDNEPPTVQHKPVTKWSQEKPLSPG